MNTSTYRIKDFSNSAFCVICIFFCVAVLIGLNKLLMEKYGNPLIILISLGAFGVVVLILGIMILKNVLLEISMNEKYLEIKWIKKPYFFIKRDVKISWDNIKSYVFEEDTYNETFKLILKDKTKIKLIHRNTYNKDDFIKFKEAFQDKISTVNSDDPNKIGKGKTIYEGISGLIFAIVIILGLIAVTITIYLNPDRALSSNPFLLLFTYGGGFYYLFMIFVYNVSNLANKNKPE